MKLRHLIGLLFFTALLGACVPNRKIVYLQHDDLKHRKRIPIDTALRNYEMDIKEYRIQPLDILAITFESITSDEYDFFQKITPQMRAGAAGATLAGVMVDADGAIDYPVVGKIALGGLTLFQARDKIQQVANQYLKDAVVRIRLLNFRVTVLGEVNGERVVISSNPRMTMMEVVGSAGGFGELADRSRVKVIRQIGSESKVFYVNLLEEEFIASPYYFVQQNDIIIVPPLQQRTFRKYFTQNIGIFTTSISTVLLIVALFVTQNSTP